MGGCCFRSSSEILHEHNHHFNRILARSRRRRHEEFRRSQQSLRRAGRCGGEQRFRPHRALLVGAPQRQRDGGQVIARALHDAHRIELDEHQRFELRLAHQLALCVRGNLSSNRTVDAGSSSKSRLARGVSSRKTLGLRLERFSASESSVARQENRNVALHLRRCDFMDERRHDLFRRRNEKRIFCDPGEQLDRHCHLAGRRWRDGLGAGRNFWRRSNHASGIARIVRRSAVEKMQSLGEHREFLQFCWKLQDGAIL